jgi:hypothetical protein
MLEEKPNCTKLFASKNYYFEQNKTFHLQKTNALVFVYLMERMGMQECYAAGRVLCFVPNIRVFVVRVKVRAPMPNGQSLLSENVGHFVIKKFSPFMSLLKRFFSFFCCKISFSL